MAAEVGDTPVTIVDMVRVLKQICNEKRLELDQRVLDEPGLRNPISDLSRDALTAVIDLGDFILKSEGALAPTFETFEPSLKRKIPEITHLVGLLDYLPPGLADLIKRICSNAAKVVDFLEGLYEAHPLSSETSFNKPTERLEELSLRFRSLSTKAVKLEIELNLEAAAKAADEARDAADASKQAAGTAADATLGSYYEKIAIEEATSARNFRIGAIVCLIVGVGIAGWIAWVIISNHEEGAASQLFKILACLPVLGVAFYLSLTSPTAIAWSPAERRRSRFGFRPWRPSWLP